MDEQKEINELGIHIVQEEHVHNTITYNDTINPNTSKKLVDLRKALKKYRLSLKRKP